MLQLIQSNLSNYLLFYHKKGFKIITAKDYGKIYHLSIFILNVLPVHVPETCTYKDDIPSCVL